MSLRYYCTLLGTGTGTVPKLIWQIWPRNQYFSPYFSPIGLFPLSGYLFYMLCFVRLHGVKLAPPAVQNLVKTGSCVLVAHRRRRCCCCVCRGRLLLKQQSATTGRQAAVATASAQRHIHIWNIWHMITEKKSFTCLEIVLSCPNRIGFLFYQFLSINNVIG